MVSLPGGAIGARPLIHSALASPLEASGSARFTQPSPPRSRRAARLDSLSPRLPARGERLGSIHSALASPLEASGSARTATLSPPRGEGIGAPPPSVRGRGRGGGSDGSPARPPPCRG